MAVVNEICGMIDVKEFWTSKDDHAASDLLFCGLKRIKGHQAVIKLRIPNDKICESFPQTQYRNIDIRAGYPGSRTGSGNITWPVSVDVDSTRRFYSAQVPMKTLL